MGSHSKNNNNNKKKKKSSNVEEDGPLQIPPADKKIVQSLKEILNKDCTDSEIYAVLVECNMDPNDAVQRLLSQDTFKEVKSKRERRKEMKETQESRARNNDGATNHGVRVGSEQAVGQTGSPENNYNELGNTSHKREIGSAATSGSSSSYIYHVSRKIINEQPLNHSDFFNADNRRRVIGTGDTVSSSLQLSLGHQPTWAGVSKGCVSMADIVRGRPPNKSSQISSETPCTSQPAVWPNSSHYHNKSPQVLSSPESELYQYPYSAHHSNVSEMIPGSSGQHDVDNEWSVIEHLPVATGSLVMEASAALGAQMYTNHSDYHGSASALSRQIFADGAGEKSNYDLLKETITFDSHGHMFQEVASAVENLQQLNIGKEELVIPPTENFSTVVLPNHLQPVAADCSHLIFGTYNSGVASLSPRASNNPNESNLEVSAADGPSAMHSNLRNSEYSDDEQLGFTHFTQRITADARNYDLPLSSQSDMMMSFLDNSFNDIQQSGSSFPFVADGNAGNLPSVPTEMHLENISIGLRSPSHQSLRMRDSSPFLAKLLMPSVYDSAVPSHPTIPISELSPHALPSSNHARGAVLPRRQLVHSQSRLSSNELGNMIGYASMPHRQTYVPSALQQTYPETSVFRDSMAGLDYDLPQYRNNGTMGGLPVVSNNGPFAHRSFAGNSSNIPRSISRNWSARAAVGYNDLLHSHHMDGNNLPRDQNNRSSTWDLGAGRQTSILSDRAYSWPGQNQHLQGYQSNGRASQHYESLMFPNSYQYQSDQQDSQRYESLVFPNPYHSNRMPRPRQQ